MRIFKQKKGTILILGLAILFIFIVLLSLFLRMEGKKGQFKKILGETQINMLETYQKAEKVLFFIDQSAKYSAEQAVYDLGQKSNFQDASKCGYYYGYELWNNETEECYPDELSLKTSLSSYLNENMNEYLSKYPFSEAVIPLDNYDFLIKDKLDITGFATRNLVLPIIIFKKKEDYYVFSNTEIDRYLRTKDSPLAGYGQCFLDAEKDIKVPAIVSIGIAVHESTWGKSGLAQKSKNLFGVKCGTYIEYCSLPQGECCKVWDKTALDLRYEPDAPNAYRIYTDWCESINDFAENVISEHYKTAMRYRDDPDEMVRKIREGGYATDPLWAEKVIGIMHQINDELANEDQITTAAIASGTPKSTDFVGTYSIKPSFKTEIDYDLFGNYRNVIELANKALGECFIEGDIKECFDTIKDDFESEDLELHFGSCDKGAKKVFYDFVENYELCLDSEDNDCICEFDLDSESSYELKGDYRIKFNDKKIKLSEPEGFELEYDVDNTPSYIGEDPSKLNEETDTDYYYAISYNDEGGFEEAKFYVKSPLRDNDFNKIYKTEDGNLAFVKDKGNKGNCKINKQIYKFCAVNTEKQFLVYDEFVDKEKPTYQSPVIKFALYRGDLPPKPIENLRVYDKKKADKSVILRWDKSKESDVDKYLIYYSKDDFKELEMQDIKEKIEPINVDSDVEEDNEFINIDLEPSCHFDEDNNKCVFKHDFTGIDYIQAWVELKNKVAYYLTDDEAYIYVLGNTEDNEIYNFAVTAVDIAGNEIDNIQEGQELIQGENYNQGTSKDDLAPGIVELEEPVIKTKEGKQVIELSWTGPLKNIDGTDMDDLEEYNVYYRKNQDLVYSLKLTVKKDETTADIDLDSLDKETEYNFAVTAVDKNKNEHNDNIIIKTIKTP